MKCVLSFLLLCLVLTLLGCGNIAGNGTTVQVTFVTGLASRRVVHGWVLWRSAQPISDAAIRPRPTSIRVHVSSLAQTWMCIPVIVV
jgi:hypothetical protein